MKGDIRTTYKELKSNKLYSIVEQHILSPKIQVNKFFP